MDSCLACGGGAGGLVARLGMLYVVLAAIEVVSWVRFILVGCVDLAGQFLGPLGATARSGPTPALVWVSPPMDLLKKK